jgi:ribonucleoside-diphosphate reductase beta chain
MKIFNTDKTDYKGSPLFMGQDPGLFDTVNKKFLDIWKLFKKQKSLDWDENEFNYSGCNKEFKTCPPSTYDMMIKTLAWQWEADSVAARALAPIMAPFVSSTELWAAYLEITKNEALHAATYSEIVRNSFDDPSVILDEVLKVQEAMDRLTNVALVFDEVKEASHQYALGLIPNDQNTYNKVFMMLVAMYMLERIQFMASFAITFSICEQGLFQPIGKAVQKIAQDESEIHAELGKVVLKYEMGTERGKKAMQMLEGRIHDLFVEIIEGEHRWLREYMFKDGTELPGITCDLAERWTLFCAKEVKNVLKIDSPYVFPAQNPLKFMENWLDMSKTQPAPQEQDNAQYKVGVMRRTDEDEEFDF